MTVPHKPRFAVLYKHIYRALGVAVLVSAFGLVTLSRSDAATFAASKEAETGTVAGNAGPGDSVGASGGASVKFGAATTPPTPSPPGSCIGSDNAPGSPDPWGGCWPGPQNSGYPHGLPGDSRTPVTLTTYTGPTTISSCGVVIDSKVVDSELLITGSNGTHSASTPCVTIKNSLVKGTIHTDTASQGPLVITDTEVAVPGSAYWASVGFYNTFGWRLNSHGGNMTLKCEAYCGYYDSWAHGGYLEKSFHYNAIGSNGNEVPTSPFVIEHNYMNCGDFEGKAPDVTAEAGCTSDLGLLGDYGPASNTSVHRNYFAPAIPTAEYNSDTQPGYCFSPGFGTNKPYNYAENLIFTENIFARGPTGKCGEFGPVGGWSYTGGNVWSDNKWDDGTPLNQ